MADSKSRFLCSSFAPFRSTNCDLFRHPLKICNKSLISWIIKLTLKHRESVECKEQKKNHFLNFSFRFPVILKFKGQQNQGRIERI